jgi:hypothetical protein
MRKYARDASGKVVLESIECDFGGCPRVERPGPHMKSSGWMHHGKSVSSRDVDGRMFTFEFECITCPDHNADGPGIVDSRVNAHREAFWKYGPR